MVEERDSENERTSNYDLDLGSKHIK